MYSTVEQVWLAVMSWNSSHCTEMMMGAAASTGHVTYGAFLASTQREISVALCKGN